ncbi:MAG: hypothetical protein ABSC50_14120 [Candidatus Bathyarchaeia archaeon]
MNEKRKSLWMVGALCGLGALRVFLAAITPFAADFHGSIQYGQLILDGVRPGSIGVYLGPSYISAGTLALWALLTHDPAVRMNLFLVYVEGPNVAGSLVTPEMYAFTLVMKIPVLITDFLTLLAIILIVKSTTRTLSKGLLAGLLWFTSPLVFLTENASLLELYPALLILLGVYLLHRSKTAAGSGTLILGTLLRLAPALFTWIYLVGYARCRQFRRLLIFLAVQVIFVLAAVFYLSSTTGWDSVVQILSGRPGIIIPEVLTTLGPFIKPMLGYNPYEIPMSFVFYLLLTYFLTKPQVWQNRSIGVEALAFFAPYYALTSFSIPFLLWGLPTLLVYSMTTRFGPTRFLTITSLGFLTYLFESSKSLMGAYGPTAVFFIPNMNSAMASFSASMSQLYLIPLVPQTFRSLFSASMLLVVFWILKEKNIPLPSKSESGSHLSNEPNLN